MSEPDPKKMSSSFQNVLDNETKRRIADGRQPPLSKVEMQAERPPTVPLPMGPAVNAMSGQEIRTRALEASVRLWAGYGIRAEEGDDPVTREFWRTVGQFEAYIRDGG